MSRGPAVVFKRGDVFEPDEIDLKIIHAIRHGGDDFTIGLVRRVGIPASSLSYRIAKLRQARVISDDLYVMKRDDQSYSFAALLVNMKIRSREAEEQLLSFAQEHANVAGCISAVGNWDYKLLVYGDSYAEVMRTEDQQLAKLSREVSSTSMYLRRQILKSGAGV